MTVEDPYEFRLSCRSTKFSTQTSGQCPGYAQANLLVIPKHAAQDFIDLCERNPVPCPLLAVTKSGDPTSFTKGAVFKNEVNLSTDFPSYNVFENGELVEKKTDITKEWTDEHVGFLVGCSFSFEFALSQAGLTPRNMSEDYTVPMYHTKKYLDPAGIFTGGSYVVSMRPYKLEDIPKVREITRAFKATHGEPIDWGYDALERLGIKSLEDTIFSKHVPLKDDEVPVFWGCGVTPQLAAAQVSDKINGKIMAHTPGCMIVIDVKDEEVPSL